MTYTFITGNAGKAEYYKQWLGSDVPHHKLDLDEIQTFDLHALVEHKARQAFGILKQPVMIEDAQLTFTALGRLPGPFIRWFLEELGHRGLTKLLDGYADRTAYGELCIGLFDGKRMHFFEGRMDGRIAAEPRGSGGFGFDPIFINNGHTVTRGEMTPDQYAQTSYRKKAIDALAEFLHHETQ